MKNHLVILKSGQAAHERPYRFSLPLFASAGAHEPSPDEWTRFLFFLPIVYGASVSSIHCQCFKDFVQNLADFLNQLRGHLLKHREQGLQCLQLFVQKEFLVAASSCSKLVLSELAKWSAMSPARSSITSMADAGRDMEFPCSRKSCKPVGFAIANMAWNERTHRYVVTVRILAGTPLRALLPICLFCINAGI